MYLRRLLTFIFPHLILCVCTSFISIAVSAAYDIASFYFIVKLYDLNKSQAFVVSLFICLYEQYTVAHEFNESPFHHFGLVLENLRLGLIQNQRNTDDDILRFSRHDPI